MQVLCIKTRRRLLQLISFLSQRVRIVRNAEILILLYHRVGCRCNQLWTNLRCQIWQCWYWRNSPEWTFADELHQVSYGRRPLYRRRTRLEGYSSRCNNNWLLKVHREAEGRKQPNHALHVSFVIRGCDSIAIDPTVSKYIFKESRTVPKTGIAWRRNTTKEANTAWDICMKKQLAITIMMTAKIINPLIFPNRPRPDILTCIVFQMHHQ